MIISNFYCLQFFQLFEGLRQILWKDYLRFLHLFPTFRIVGEFHRLEVESIYVAHAFLRALIPAGLFHLYQRDYPGWFRGINDQDCNKVDCRSDGKPTIRQGLTHKLFHTLIDVNKILYQESDSIVHNHPYPAMLSIPSILTHYKKYWISLCRFSPGNYLFVFVINFAYQHLLIRCWSFPWASQRRRDLCLLDYNMGGV
jgi:hypothetical protein